MFWYLEEARDRDSVFSAKVRQLAFMLNNKDECTLLCLLETEMHLASLALLVAVDEAQTRQATANSALDRPRVTRWHIVQRVAIAVLPPGRDSRDNEAPLTCLSG